MNLQGGNYQVQQVSKKAVQKPAAVNLQPAKNVMNYVDPVPNSVTNTPAAQGSLGVTVDPQAASQAAAAAKAAADAAKASALRGNVTDLVNSIKSLFNARYGMINDLAGEQSNKLYDRYNTESGDLTQQIEGENQALGAAHAASGTFDSSYRGNNVDTVTREGKSQIRDLGSELEDNIAKIASWVTEQKASTQAQENKYDKVKSHLGEEVDPGRLTDLRNTVEGDIEDTRANNATYRSKGSNAKALASIAPSNSRVAQLKTTLSQVVGGTADPNSKSVIAKQLIKGAGLGADDEHKLILAFEQDLADSSQDDTQQA